MSRRTLLDVVGVDAAEPLVGLVADLALVVAEHRLPARREVDLVGAEVPVPQPVVGAAHRERVALLALAQRLPRPACAHCVRMRAIATGKSIGLVT